MDSSSAVATAPAPAAAAAPVAAAPAAASTTAAAAAPAVNATPYASASLYVGDLAADVTENMLFEIFNSVGPVASVRVCRDAATRRSLGYAYVNFHRVDDAEKALDTMNFSVIRSRPCRIMWSQRDPALRKSGQGNIFVKNLDASIDNKTLYDTFSIFGNILSCKVSTNSKGESLGYGFVHFESDEAAKTAIQRVNGMVIANRKVIVAPFKSRSERGANDKTKFTNVYVKNLPDDFTKEQLDELFNKFGTVTSSMLASGDDAKARGFGFVNFEQPEAAAAAVDALNGYEVKEKKLYVARAQKREERERELKERFEMFKLERQKKYAGINLYIKNLADEIDDAKLTELFAPYGNITSARVMKHPGTNRSRGFGFVCYSTPDEATKAVTDMNNKMVSGKPLYVALAQRKEVRRAALEQQHAQRNKGMMAQPGIYGAQPMYYAGPRLAAQPIMYAQPMNAAMRPGAFPGPARPRQMGMPAPMNYMNIAAVNPAAAAAAAAAAQQQQVQQGAPQGQGRGRGGRGQGKPKNGVPPPQGAAGPQGRGRGQPQGFPAYAMRAGPMSVQGAPQGVPAAARPINPQELAAASEEQQKQMIGERLFPLIQQREPLRAGKITGMLLEMDNSELLHLLESQEALRDKIAEALAVLQAHEPQEEGTAQ